VAARQFREDLFYRLNVVRIRIPPLRERREDIGLLVSYFLKRFTEGQGGSPKSVSPEVLVALERYAWPGNVRELENVIQRATVLARGRVILLSDLPAEVAGTRDAQDAVPTVAPAEAGERAGAPAADDPAGLARALFRWARQDAGRKVLPAVERELVVQALQETGGNQVRAARLLGMTRATLRKRIAKYHIQRGVSVR